MYFNKYVTISISIYSEVWSEVIRPSRQKVKEVEKVEGAHECSLNIQFTMENVPFLVTPIWLPNCTGNGTNDVKSELFIKVKSDKIFTEHHIELHGLKSESFGNF